MKLKEKIEKDIIVAMKEKNIVKRETLKYVKAQIQVAEMEKNAKEADDAKVIKIMEKCIEGMVQVGNAESLAQIEILNTYIPKKMSEDEIRIEVKKIIESGGNNIGFIMGKFNVKFSGLADNKIVSSITKELLG